MRFDRKKFFAKYQAKFGVSTQYQVDGLNRLLWGFETFWGWWDQLPQIANAFAQIKLETAHTFNPVCEAYYLGDPKQPNFYTGNTKVVFAVQRKFYYFPYFGRGDIQLTHKENYELLTIYLRKYFPEIVAEFETRTQKTFDLVKTPEQALDGKISFCCMTVGMHKGLFRKGHTLDRYITPLKADHFNARSIVNGDKYYEVKNSKPKITIGEQIANYAKLFEEILTFSLIDESVFDSDPAVLTDVSLPSEPVPPINFPAPLPDAQSPAIDDSPTPDTNQTLTPLPTIDINTQDYKPFFKRWIKTVWGWFTGVNFAQFPLISSAGAFGGNKYWWIGIVVAVAFFLFTLFAALTISAVLLLILFWNRIENFLSRRFADFLKANPRLADPKIKTEYK